MTAAIIQISDQFWNIRGEFKVGGLIDIGTHTSLVRRENDEFVLLDAYTLSDDVKIQVDELTEGGAKLAAIINLHPFHTVHTQRAHEQYPNASLYGTRRHLELFPNLPWQRELTESEQFQTLFAPDFEFSIPAGVDFISRNEHLHFASVLAYHKASKTIHSDDTLMYLRLPGLLGKLKPPQVTFHMTLARTLQKRAGAAAEFRTWAEQLIERWHDAENLCAAHSACLLAADRSSHSIAQSIEAALKKVDKTLSAHARKYG